MVNPNKKQQPLILPDPRLSESQSADRLIVPISSPDIDIAIIARRLWDLAAALQADVKFVGLYTDPNQEPGIRRVLVTMVAMLKSASVSADMEVLPGKDWGRSVRSSCHPGDTVVCWDEQQSEMLRKPMSQLLQAELNVPLVILSSGKRQIGSHTNKKHQIVAWIGFAAIMIGFLLIQIQILTLSDAWTITLEIVSTAIEFWLLWGWNSLFG